MPVMTNRQIMSKSEEWASSPVSSQRPKAAIASPAELRTREPKRSESQPLIDYILSGKAARLFVGERLERLRAIIEQELAAQEAIHISTASGLFIAHNRTSERGMHDRN